jgi:hypothetical protein
MANSIRTNDQIIADMRENNSRKPVVYAVSMLYSQAYRPSADDREYLQTAADLCRELLGTNSKQQINLTVKHPTTGESLGFITFTR